MKIYNLFYTILVCIMILNACNNDSEQKKLQQAQDTEQIKKTFNEYKNAVLDKRGYDAMKCLNQKTIHYYDNILKEIQYADKERIVKMSAADQLEILAIRHLFPKEHIFSLTGITLYSTAITEGLWEMQGLKALSIGHVAIKGDKAKAQITINGAKTPIYYDFSKEDNQWKINVATAKVLVDKFLKNEAEKTNQTALSYILNDLKLSEDEKIKIFEPLKAQE